MKGFRDFLLRGNPVDMAVGIVIGAAFATIVTSLVKDMITPLIAAIGGKPDFSALTFTINRSVFRYGDFVNSLIAFLIIAAVVYFFVVMPFASLLRRVQGEPKPGTRKCPECLTDIPIAARRCAACTQEVPALS